MSRVNLDDIPTGFNPDEEAEKLAAIPKQKSDDALNIGKLTPEDDNFVKPPGETTGSEEPGPLSATRLKNHEHARQNADIVAMLIGFVVAFALITLVDKQGGLTDYNFTDQERNIVSQGFETWFNTFEEDFVVPGILAAFTPLAGVIYVKYEQAASTAKARLPQPPIANTQHPVASHQPPITNAQQITEARFTPVPPQPAAAEQPAPAPPQPPTANTQNPKPKTQTRKPKTKRPTAKKPTPKA